MTSQGSVRGKPVSPERSCADGKPDEGQEPPVAYHNLAVLAAIVVVSCLLHLYNLGWSELQGDEASAVIKGVQLVYAVRHPRLLGALFLYGHEPVRALLTVPMLLVSGLSEFALRLPNALAGAATTAAIAWASLLWFEGDWTTTLVAAALYASSGGALVNRLAMGVGPFLLASTLTLAGLAHYRRRRDRRGLWLAAAAYSVAVLTYADALFLLPGIVGCVIGSPDLRQDGNVRRAGGWVALVVGSFALLWAAVPVVAARLGVVSDWAGVGLWRILRRGVGGLTDDPLTSLRLLLSFNGPLYTAVVTAGVGAFLVRALSHQSDRQLGSIALLPLLYFSLIRRPTVHLLNFSPLLALLSARGWSLLSRWKLVGAMLLVFAISSAFFAGSGHTLRIEADTRPGTPPVTGWGLPHLQGLKAAAGVIRSWAEPCDLVHSPLDGYVIQLCTGHRPSPADDGQQTARFALWPLDDPAADSIPPGYRRFATVAFGGVPTLAVLIRTQDETKRETVQIEATSGSEAFAQFDHPEEWLPAQWAGCPIP